MQKVFNLQPIEKSDLHEDGSLDVHSIFSTIQGEGPFVGQPAVFVRLAGCNLQCPLCDTEYTSGRMRMTYHVVLDHIWDIMIGVYKPLIVITGGEPFRQNLQRLVGLLLDKGFRVQIETNGSLFQELPFGATIVCSPKASKINSKLERYVTAFKYVLKAGDIGTDGLPTHALDHPNGGQVARPPLALPRQSIYVQPVDTQDAEENKLHLAATIQSARQHGYTLCLQTHKLLDLP